MSITLENQLNSTIDRLCEIKALLHEGKAESALVHIRSLESSLHQALAIVSLDMISLENSCSIERISCKDYPPLVVVK